MGRRRRCAAYGSYDTARSTVRLAACHRKWKPSINIGRGIYSSAEIVVDAFAAADDDDDRSNEG